jgi:hypothetical protein
MNAEYDNYIISPPKLKRQNAFCLRPGQSLQSLQSLQVSQNNINNISSEIFNLQQNQFEVEIDFAEILHREISNDNNYDN